MIYTRKCPVCNEIFITENYRKIYCSSKCCNKGSKLNKFEHECINCKKIISGKGNKTKQFCSKECERQYTNEIQKERLIEELNEEIAIDRWTHVESILRDIVYIKVSEIINKSNNSSNAKVYNGQAINYWELGDIPRDTRKFVLQRDNNECQVCQNKNNLHIHHIIKRVNGGDHSPQNLITLCASCHRHIEVGDINYATEKCLKNALRYYNIKNNKERKVSFESIYDSLIDIYEDLIQEKDVDSTAKSIDVLIDKIEQYLY